MLRRGFVPVVIIIAITLVALFGGTVVVAWRTTVLDSYLPQATKEFLGKSQTGDNGVPTTSDTQELGKEDSETTTEDPTKDWKTYINEELDFSFKYPESWGKKQIEADNEVILLESADGKSYMNFYDSGGAFGIEPGFENSESEVSTYYTSDNYQVKAEITYLDSGEVLVSGSLHPRIPGLVFTYDFDQNLAPDGLDILSLIMSTFRTF